MKNSQINESSNFEYAVNIILQFEGGYVSDHRDPGGSTKYGITQAVYDAWLKNLNESSMDVILVTRSEAKDIYKSQYWDRIRGDELPKRLAICLFDFAVHSGVSKAIHTLQRVLGVEPDGVIGLVTLDEIRKKDESLIIENLLKRRLNFLKSLSVWKFYKNGWKNRIQKLSKICLEDQKRVFSELEVVENISLNDLGKKASPKKASFLKNPNMILGSGIGGGEILRQIYMYMEYTKYSEHIICVAVGVIVVLFTAYLCYQNFKSNRNR